MLRLKPRSRMEASSGSKGTTRDSKRGITSTGALADEVDAIQRLTAQSWYGPAGCHAWRVVDRHHRNGVVATVGAAGGSYPVVSRTAGGAMIRASNRQLKLLRFFKVPLSERISQGAAGWE